MLQPPVKILDPRSSHVDNFFPLSSVLSFQLLTLAAIYPDALGQPSVLEVSP